MKLRTELIAGITTFFTMSYIVIVNPAILATEGTGMAFDGVLTATVLICFLMTLLMGLYANLPYGVAPGMGINAFFAYTVILSGNVPWQTALGLVFWAGVLFVFVSITPIREKIAQSIPPALRLGVASGIGIFLTFIGLKNAGIIQSNPETFVAAAPIRTESGLALLGLLIMVPLVRRKNPFSFLIGIFSVTLIAALLGMVELPRNLLSAPDFSSVFFELDIWGALQLALLPTMISIFFTDLFDSISTFIGVSHATGMVDKKGNPIRLKQGLVVDAWATLGAGLVGSSSGTAYIESASGIEAGGRTGRTALVTAFCFLPCFFIAPVAAMVPAYATAPVLVLVGTMMFRSIRGLELEKLEDAVPAYLTIVLIPLTFSITQGILWGFISHVVLYVLCGRAKEISLTLYLLSFVAVGLLAIESHA